jgi:hypothetical protein
MTTNTTDIHVNYNRDTKNVSVNDGQHNKFKMHGTDVPDITCNGVPQHIDMLKVAVAAMHGSRSLLSANIDEHRPVLANPLDAQTKSPFDGVSAALDGLKNIRKFDGNVTVNGANTLTALCKLAQKDGYIHP